LDLTFISKPSYTPAFTRSQAAPAYPREPPRPPPIFTRLLEFKLFPSSPR
jgi:hypothetical protein